MIRIQRLPANTRGRDFVMGDLHGETEMLDVALAEVDFDPIRDRLFSVGDLIDRGPRSRQALNLLDQASFFPVMGNHERMMINAVIYGVDLKRWEQGGGTWAKGVDPFELRTLASRLDDLPHLIVVGQRSRRFHIVHAGLVDRAGEPLTDAIVDANDLDPRIELGAVLHARTHAERYKAVLASGADFDQRTHVGLSLTFCGHTPVPQPGRWRSHYFCDGGAGSAIYLPPGRQPRLHVICVDDLLP